MKTSTGKPTKYEAQRIEAMLRLGCCYCALLDLWFVAECHHIVVGNRRLGHWYTLPACPGHHRGAWTADQIDVIPPDLRVAISDGSKRLEVHYGTERELWMKVQARLKLPAVWPSSKILPRGVTYVGVADRSLAVLPIPAPGAQGVPIQRGELCTECEPGAQPEAVPGDTP